MAPAGAGMPVKYAACHLGFSTSSIVLKRASRRPVAIANTMATIQPRPRGRATETPDEDDHGRSDAEVDEVGEAVELGAELRLGSERARQPAIDAVEQRRDDDEPDRILVSQLDGHADGGEAGAEAQQREEIGHQHAHGDAAVAKQDPAPPAALALLQPRQHMVHGMSSPFLRPRRYCTRASRSGSVDLRSASTVSPPTARWPTATNAPWPGGR